MSRNPDKPRLYVVEDTADGAETLVRAMNKQASERAVNQTRFRGRLASQDDVLRLAQTAILDATVQPQSQAPAPTPASAEAFA